jgi:hypothetical protein
MIQNIVSKENNQSAKKKTRRMARKKIRRHISNYILMLS